MVSMPVPPERCNVRGSHRANGWRRKIEGRRSRTHPRTSSLEALYANRGPKKPASETVASNAAVRFLEFATLRTRHGHRDVLHSAAMCSRMATGDRDIGPLKNIWAEGRMAGEAASPRVARLSPPC